MVLAGRPKPVRPDKVHEGLEIAQDRSRLVLVDRRLPRQLFGAG
jgi:hypothetical protein